MLVAVVAVLALAYRTLGGAQQTPVEADALLNVAASSLAAALSNLDAHGAARDTRRSVGAAQQCLDRLPTGGHLSTAQAGVGDLLAAACEDLTWALRIGSATTRSTGVTSAATALVDHARACSRSAAELASGAARGEPGDGL